MFLSKLNQERNNIVRQHLAHAGHIPVVKMLCHCCKGNLKGRQQQEGLEGRGLMRRAWNDADWWGGPGMTRTDEEGLEGHGLMRRAWKDTDWWWGPGMTRTDEEGLEW